MTPRMVTYDEVLTILREIVGESPDYVYEKPDGVVCFNVWQGKPSCVVGHVMPRVGIEVEWMETYAMGSAADDLLDEALARHLVTFATDEERARVQALLVSVQTHQDNGVKWGSALVNAESDMTHWVYEEADDDY